MQKTVYAPTAEDTGAGPSKKLWHDCPWMEIMHDPGMGYAVHDEFLGMGDLTGAPYGIDESDDKASVNGIELAGGALRLAITGDDNEEVFAHYGNFTFYPFVISDTAGADKKLWFETRIRTSSIATDQSLIVGLVDTTLAAGDDTLQAANTGTVADLGFIGFQALCASPTSLDWIYRKNGGALVTKISAADTLVANTWVKAGFKYDPDENTARRITCHINGAPQSTYITGTNIATATFPDAVALNFVIGAKVGTDQALNVDCDWWRCAQLR